MRARRDFCGCFPFSGPLSPLLLTVPQWLFPLPEALFPPDLLVALSFTSFKSLLLGTAFPNGF